MSPIIGRRPDLPHYCEPPWFTWFLRDGSVWECAHCGRRSALDKKINEWRPYRGEVLK